MIDAATVAQAISARLEGGNVWFDGVSIDSRVVRPGELFVAIKGERFDGHEFVAQAFSRGAYCRHPFIQEKRLANFRGELSRRHTLC